MKRIIRLVSALALLGMFSVSQQSLAQMGEVSIEGLVGVPQADFRNEINRAGLGIGLTGGYQFPRSPVQVGAKFGFMNYGIDRRNAPLSTTIPDITVRVENQYNIVQGHGYLRLTPPTGPFRPYVEGLAGFNYLFTQTAIYERGSNEEKLTDTNFDDTAFSYGLGGGFKVLLYADAGSNMYLDMRANYMFGNSATYLKKGSITVENGQAYYDAYRSATDMLLLQVGVSITF
jgi:hypothetical protein